MLRSFRATGLATLIVLWEMPAIVAQPQAIQDRVPILAELFTSEGCSSCPPADRILEWL